MSDSTGRTLDAYHKNGVNATHLAGVEKFGATWWNANRAAVNTARKYRFDVDSHEAMISEIVYWALAAVSRTPQESDPNG